MNLHRQKGVPEWETVDPSTWNEAQKRAAETNGWDTPGNRESVKGLVATGLGLFLTSRKHPAAKGFGIASVVYGRLKDLKDGKVADATGTKSPLGEAVDASFDKVGVAGSIATTFKTGAVSQAELIALGVQQGANIILTSVAKIRGRECHAGHAGKIGMFGIWGGLTAHFVGDVLHSVGHSNSGDVAHKTGRALMFVSTALSAVGTVIDLAPAALGPKPIDFSVYVDAPPQQDPWIEAAFGRAEWPTEEPPVVE